MAETTVYRLQLQATDHLFQLQSLETSQSDLAEPSAPIDDPVPEGIIGYWVDVLGQDCSVLYRKFVNHLPLNLPLSWAQWGTRKRKRAQFSVEIPVLPGACFVRLYEQRLTAQNPRIPERQKHFQCPLSG